MAKQIDDPSLTTFDAAALDGGTALVPASLANADGNIQIKSAARQPVSAFATAAQGTLADSALQAADIGDTVAAQILDNLTATVAPTTAANDADGYTPGLSRWLIPAEAPTARRFWVYAGQVDTANPTHGIWIELGAKGSLKHSDLLDAETYFGDLAFRNAVEFVEAGQIPFRPFDAGGDPDATRPAISATSTVYWYNCPTVPTEFGVADMWAGPGGETIRTITTSETGVLADAGKVIRSNSASTIIYTVPANIFSANTRITFRRGGAGAFWIRTGSGLTLNGDSSLTLSVNARYLDEVTLRFISTTVAEISGNLTEEASAPTLSVPTAGFSVTDTGTHWLVESTSTGALGNIVVGDADITNAWDLLIGGGASGARGSTAGNPGGGGAGAFLERNPFTLAIGTYAVVVGTGGAAVSGSNANGNSGVASTFGARTAGGGGGGGNNGSGLNGADGSSGGGSGGGGVGAGNVPGTGSSPGTAGGNDFEAASGSRGAGGGGGAGSAGGDGASATGGTGGAGASSSITGTAVTYCAGGQGNGTTTPSAPTGSTNLGSGTPGQVGGTVPAGKNGGYKLLVEKSQIASVTRT